MMLIYIIVYEIAEETNTLTNVARNAISSSHAIIINICEKLIKHIATKQRTIQNRLTAHFNRQSLCPYRMRVCNDSKYY